LLYTRDTPPTEIVYDDVFMGEMHWHLTFYDRAHHTAVYATYAFAEDLEDAKIGRGETRIFLRNIDDRGLEPLHASFTLARRPMRVLTPVVEITTLAMLHPGQYLTLGRAIAFELIGNEHAGHIAQALEQLFEELLGGLLVAPTLHQDIAEAAAIGAEKLPHAEL
jgi:hypothetical protein